MEQYLLGIDLGTSGTKTVLFRPDGSAVASATEEYPMDQPQNGWAEQHPEDWWRAAHITIRAVLASSSVPPGSVKALGISGQMHGLVMLDEAGQVLHPAILWCDQRTAKECQEITDTIGAEELIRITANPALTGFTLSKVMWMKKHHPEIFARCRHILLPKDYLRYRLTGDFVSEVSDASGMQMMDVPNRTWSTPLLDRLAIPTEWLPRLVESPEVTGHLTRAAADATGLTPDTLVVGGAGDNAAAAVGTGVVMDGKAFTTIGTSGVVFAHTDQLRIDPRGRVHTFCAAVPGTWHVMGVTQGAGLSLKWFRDQFCQAEKETAAAMGVDPYELMNQAAAQSPIGANRLLYAPYLMGERTPHLDPCCRGAFIGLSALHQKRDLIRAVMEGVACSLKDCQEVLREMDVLPTTMLVCGGGGRSPLWRQMLSNLMNLPVATLQSNEGPALGVAILAAVGIGLYRSVPEACAAMVRENPPQAPVASEVAQYARLYDAYQAVYPANKALYQKLAAL